MTDCIVRIDGCQLCDERIARLDPNHQCAALCEMGQRIIRAPGGHRVFHQPLRHTCGFVVDDRRGNRTRGTRRICPYGTCVQFFCVSCRRYDMGWGLVLCPCETRRHGHGTYAEFSRPSVKHLVKRLR